MVDVSDWRPTTHCKQMRRQRNIDWEAVAAAVANEHTELDGHNGCVLRSAWYDGHLVRVVLALAEQQVVSVYRWCNKNDESCAELDPAEHSRWLPER